MTIGQCITCTIAYTPPPTTIIAGIAQIRTGMVASYGSLSKNEISRIAVPQGTGFELLIVKVEHK